MNLILYGINDVREVPISWVAEMCVKPGWNRIVSDLLNDLFELGWDGRLFQLKEKFGCLRVYLGGQGSSEMYDRIEKAEIQSTKTCDQTGGPGERRYDLGWIRTLCDEEYEKQLIKDKEWFGE